MKKFCFYRLIVITAGILVALSAAVSAQGPSRGQPAPELFPEDAQPDDMRRLPNLWDGVDNAGNLCVPVHQRPVLDDVGRMRNTRIPPTPNFVDMNNNGLKDAGEVGIGGVRIWLNGTARDGSTIQRQQLTAGDGAYLFDDLPAGVYQLTQEQPLAYLDGRDTSGTAPTDLVENNRFVGVRLAPGVDAVSFLFGERVPVLSKRLFLGSTR